MKRDRRILFGICLLFTIGLFVSCGDETLRPLGAGDR
jgi:hypothetical protein